MRQHRRNDNVMDGVMVCIIVSDRNNYDMMEQNQAIRIIE